MGNETHGDKSVLSQNDKYFRIEKNTTWIAGLILAGLIFVSNLVGAWVLQGKDISHLTETVSALATEVKVQQGKSIINSERITVLEYTGKTNDDRICKIEKIVESIRLDQLAYYRSKGFKVLNEEIK